MKWLNNFGRGLKRAAIRGGVAFFLFQSAGYSFAEQAPISLPEAERIAINNSPELKRFTINSHALQNQAVAEGQFSDPQLILGAANVPTNSFSFTQDDMTMINVGLQQTFPRGRSLSMKSKQTKALATAEQRKGQEQAAMLLRNVRETWLDLYYWTQALNVIHENRSLYKRLLKAVKAQYSNGKGTESDVLQLQVELSRLNDQTAQIEQKIDMLRAQLGRWIGQDQAKRLLPPRLPNWPNPMPMNVLKNRLQQHPLLQVDLANIEAAQDEVAYAKEQYKPGWTLDVGYGIRHGTYQDGMGGSRSNFVGAQVTVDLPVFTGNRQDKSYQASADHFEGALLDRDAHYRDLLKELTAQYEIWRSLTKRQNIYRRQLVPEAKQNSKAALLSYRHATANLTTILRAYSNQLTIQLEQSQVKVECAKARAALLYLEGVTQ